jgi:D-alanyl-lipoteichoic acid acyltransferase DltB (MBOAT superfamily)
MTTLCFLTADLATTGPIWRWLHLSPLLGGCLTALFLLWTTVRRLRTKKLNVKAGASETMKSNLESTKLESSIWKRVKGQGRKINGLARWPTVFSLACVSLLLFGASRIPKYETVTRHNVKVFLKVDDNKWAMSDDEDGKFLYTGCRDFPNEKVIWAGYVADWAKWEERGECKSIRRADLMFHWKRDAHYNVVRIDQGE